MKKIYSIIFMLVIIFSFSCVHAENINIVVSPQKVMVNGEQKDFEVYNINGNNFFKLRDIAYSLNETLSQFSVRYSEEKKLIEVQKGEKYVSLGSEMKIGEDKSKTAVKSSQEITIDNIEQELLAYNIGGNNFFKLRELGEKLDFEVDYDAVTNMVLVESKKETEVSNIEDVVAKIFNGVIYVEVTCDLPITEYADAPLYDETSNRIILDISDSKFALQDREVLVNYGGLTKIRLGDQGGNKNRVVLDVDDEYDYKVMQSADKKVLYLALSKNFELANLNKEPEKVLLVYNGSIISIPNDNVNSNDNSGNSNNQNNQNEQNKSGEVLESGEVKVPDTPTEIDLKNRIKISSVKYSSTTNKVKINGEKNFDYTVDIQENPYRIVIDIENAVLDVDGPTSITPNNKNITEIRFAQNDLTKVRVVLELKTELKYTINEKDEMIEVLLDESEVKNVSYSVFEDYAIFTLYNVKKSVFSVSESSRYNKYTLKYSESRFSTPKETLEFDDNFVENIEIKSGKIIIDGQDDVEFKMKQDGDNVLITIKSENNKSSSENEDFIILLDAGHGGSDPGSCHGDTEAEKHDPENQEKTYNLAILLKLKDLLKENGYTVYTTRTKDVTLTVNDRVGLATEEYPEASLYVSIHNNSLANKNYSGTLIMYCDRDTSEYNISNKQFAEYVLEELVSELDTVDRGFIKVAENDTSKRVLTEVPMPSILCEVAFVSNDDEFARLKTEEFQESAARAIYNGIVEAKEQMSK